MSVLEVCCVDRKLAVMDFLRPSDTPIDIFHFLGKILYAKRLETASERWKAIEGQLDENVKPEYRREFPPKDDLSTLAQTSSLSNSAVSFHL
jgi:hypothetical protein